MYTVEITCHSLCLLSIGNMVYGDARASPVRGPGRPSRSSWPVKHARIDFDPAEPGLIRHHVRSFMMSSRWVTSLCMAFCSTFPYHLREWHEEGRARLALLAFSVILAGTSILCALYGPVIAWRSPLVTPLWPNRDASTHDDGHGEDVGAGHTACVDVGDRPNPTPTPSERSQGVSEGTALHRAEPQGRRKKVVDSPQSGFRPPRVPIFLSRVITPTDQAPVGPMEQMDPAKDVGGPSSADQWSSQRLFPLRLAGGSVEQWENLLAPGLKRAGPDIFTLMRSTGATSVRDWLSRCFEGPRRSVRWWDVWSVATRADSIISSSDNPAQLADVLANSDELEVELRRLAAHVYEARTGDRQGAASMLAVKAPGAHVDIAPS